MPLDPSIPLSVRPFQGVNILAIQEAQRRQEQEARLAEQDKFEQEKYKAAREEFAQQQAEKKALGEAYQSAGGDRQELINQMVQRGLAHKVPDAIKQFNEIDKGALELDEIQARTDELKRRHAEAQTQGVGQIGALIESLGNDQNAWELGRKIIRDSNGKWGSEDQLTPFDATIASDPSKIPAITAVMQKKAGAKPAGEVKASDLVQTTDENGKPIWINASEAAGKPVVEKQATPRSDRLVQVTGPNGKPIFVRESEAEGMQPYVRPRAATGGTGGGVSLSPDAVEDAAAAYRLLGTRGIPTRFTDQDKKIIMNKAAEQARALGQSGASVIQKQAAFQADKAALTKMRSASSAAQAFEDKAINQIDMIKGLSAKVPRTSFPLINAALQAGRTEVTGDTNATQLANAIDTFTAEYAKIISGATGSSAAATDSARAASAKLLNAAMSKGTMNDVLNLMQREMRLTIRGYDTVIGDITDRMGGQPAAAAPAASAPAAAGGKRDPLGIR